MITLRPVRESDLELLYEHQADPEWATMAAFESRERESFLAHQRRVLGNPDNVMRTVEVDGEPCGSVGSWLEGGRRHVGYGFGRAFWGRGIATEALRVFIGEVGERPLYAYVAATNLASQRVLEKAGFVLVERALAPDGIEECLFRLD